MKRWFGRITAEHQREKLHAEALELERKNRVLASYYGAVSRRADMDQRHAHELAEHYANEARIFSPSTQGESQ